jgi:hypothetical protein
MDFIIDGNAYLNVAISVSRNIAYRDKAIGSKFYVNDIFNDGKFILKEQVKIQFRNFCLNYLNSLIAPISNVNRVHLVFDSRSWRKDYINNFFKNSEFTSKSAPEEFSYKGNRKRNEPISAFFDYFHDEIVPALSEHTGINIYRIPGTEGDDLIAYLCETLNTDIIIYTVDGDIKQLVYSNDKNVVVMYPKQSSKHKKICVPVELKDTRDQNQSSDVNDFFSLDESNISEQPIKKAISTLIEKEHVEYLIDPVQEIFHKIFRGDTKDNIPKINKMTPTKTSKMIDLIKEKYPLNSIDLLDANDETFIDFIVKNISKLNNLKEEVDIKELENHVRLNIKIIRLNTNHFPDDILGLLNESVYNTSLSSFKYSGLNNLKNNPSLI